jgi:hypothetical protein
VVRGRLSGGAAAVASLDEHRPVAHAGVLLRLAPVLHDLSDTDGAIALLGEARDILTAFPEGA